jgi:hypothetical protein
MRRSTSSFSLFVIVLLTLSVPLWAGSVPVVNAGFEADVLGCSPGPSCFDFGVVPGWSASLGFGGSTFKPSTGLGGEFPSGIPGGVNVAAVGDPGNAEITQDLGFAPAPNTTYTLGVSVGQRTDAALTSYYIELLVGSTIVASTTSPIPGPGTFVLVTAAYNSGTSPGGQDLSIVLGASGGGQADYDNVTLNTASSTVPEPPSLMMFGSGIVGLAGVLRRKISL